MPPAGLDRRYRLRYGRAAFVVSMKPVTSDNFGLLIAYLLPGFLTLWAAKPFVPALASWLGTAPAGQPMIGGFLYATLGSTAAGLLVSTVRWAVIDTLHHRTGIPLPRWDLERLPQTLAAFESLVEDHYRYYQFHANGLIAVIFAYLSRLVAYGRWPGQQPLEDVAFVMVAAILYVGSRDTMAKYVARTSALFEGSPAP